MVGGRFEATLCSVWVVRTAHGPVSSAVIHERADPNGEGEIKRRTLMFFNVFSGPPRNVRANVKYLF